MTKSGFDAEELERLLAAVGDIIDEWDEDEPRDDWYGWQRSILRLTNHIPAILTEIRQLRAENARLKEALEWALAEIDGRTRYRDTEIYTAQDQRDNALELARAALGEPQ